MSSAPPASSDISREASRLRFTPVAVVLAPAILLVAVAIDWITGLRTTLWDWDVDHFIYFGQRLLAGEFHWTVEFDDKLAINQILFALPAAFEAPIRAWQTLSILSTAAAALGVAWLIADSLRGALLSSRHIRFTAAIGAVLTLFGFAYLPGSISHINAFATSTGALAAVLLLLAERRARLPRVLLMLLAALLASVAIGLRPYLLVALLALPIWLSLRQMAETGRVRPHLTSGALTWLVWTGLVGGFGLITNVLPYLMLGEVQTFRDGMSMLRQSLIPGTLNETVYTQYRSMFYDIPPINRLLGLCWLLGGGFAVYGLLTRLTDVLPRRTLADIAILSLLLPLLIQIMILERHYWPHYLQMFVPFAAFGGAMLYAIVLRTGAGAFARFASYAVLGAVILFLVFPVKLRLEAIIDDPTRESPGERAFHSFLDARAPDRRSFLAPVNMHLHWQRAEGRHGFPHAANTRFITEFGWWENIVVPLNSGLPRNTLEYCQKLEDEGPELVVFFEPSPLIACLEASSTYQDTVLADGAWLFQRP